jgi:hypothetical protein
MNALVTFESSLDISDFCSDPETHANKNPTTLLVTHRCALCPFHPLPIHITRRFS